VDEKLNRRFGACFFMSIVFRLFFCVGTVEIVFVVMFASTAGTLFSLGGYSHLK